MQTYMNKYVCLSKKKFFVMFAKLDKCMGFYVIKIRYFEYKIYITCKGSHCISNA